MSPVDDGQEKAETPGSGAPPRRRPRLRRFVRALAGVALLALLLLALVVSFLHTPAGSTAARVLLERWASAAAGGPVRIGGLDLQLWRGEASATAVSLSLPGVSFDAQGLDLRWSPGAGPSVRLLRPVVVVRDTGEPPRIRPPAAGLAAQPWRALDRLGRAQVVEGRVELRDAKGAAWLVLGRIDAEAKAGPRGIGVRVADAFLGRPEGGVLSNPASAEATLSLEAGALVLETARVASGTASVRLSGRLDRLFPVTAAAKARVEFDGDLVAALAPGTQVTGRVEGDVSVDVVEDRVKGALEVASPALRVMGVGPWAARGRARIEGPQLVLGPFTAEGALGRLVAEGPIALLPSAGTDVRVRAEGIDVAAVARVLAGADVPVASRASGALRWTTTGWDVDAARGSAEVALRPAPSRGAGVPGLPLAGSGRLRLAGRALALEEARVLVHGASLEARGTLSPAGAIAGSWRGTLPLEAVGAFASDLGSTGRLPEGYSGELSAQGELAGTTAAPEASVRLHGEGLSARGKAHAVEAEARYAAGRLSLAPLAVRSGRGELSVAGSLPLLAAAGEWDVEGEARAFDLAPVLAMLGLECGGEASGALRLTGPRSTPSGRVELQARLALPAGERTEEASVAFSAEAEARYALGRLSLAPLAVRSGGGELTLAGSLPLLAGAGDWDVEGEARAFDVAPALVLLGLEGGGEASGTLRLTGPRSGPAGRADLQARLALPAGKKKEEAIVALSAEAEGARLRLSRFEAELAGGRVVGSGAFDTASRAAEAKAEATGLDWSRLPYLPVAARRLGGTLAASLTFSGTADAPSGEARAALAGTTLDGSALPDLALDARADGRRLDLAGRAGGAGVLKGGGPLEGDWPLRLEVDVSALPAQALLETLPGARRSGMKVEARGTVVIDVALRDPGRLRYAGEGLAASGSLRRLEWSTAPFRVEGTAGDAVVSGLRLTTRTIERPQDAARAREADEGGPLGLPPATGVLAVDGRVPLAGGRPFDLAVKGDLALAAVEAIAPDSQAGGRASVEVRVGGTLEAPDVDGTFDVVGGRVRVEDARVSAVQVKGRFAGREAIVERASARVLGGRLLASGSFPLAKLDAGRAAKLHVELADVDVSRLAVPGPERTADSPSFLVSVSGDIEADAPRLEGMRGQGQLTRLESRSTEGTVGLAAAAAWRLAGGRLVLDPLRLEGPLGTLEARGELGLAGAPRGSFSFSGPFDLRLVSPFVPDTTLAGPARIDLRAEWDGKATRLDGRFDVENGRVTLETLAFTASALRGEVRFLGDRAELDATAEAGDGRVVAYGGMSFGPRLLGPAALSIEAERLPVAYPEGFRARASGALLVEGDAARYRVSGLVDLTQAFYTAEFDARKGSLDRLDYQLAALRARGSVADALPLAIDVRLKDPLRIRNSQAQLDVTGTITANGTLAQPAATGQLALVEGGRLTVRRARIRVEEGRVELNGYPAGTPEVDFEGLTQVSGVTMAVRAQGSLDDLQLDISSPNRPEMSQTDLVALLLTGRTSTAAADQGMAILAEEVAAALGGALQQKTGDTLLIDVSSDDSMLLDEGDPTQRFRIGTRVSRDLSVFYSTRLDGTEQRWVGQWNPRLGRFTFRAIDDREEGVLVEASDRLSFNVFPGRERRRRTDARLVKVASLRLEGELPLPREDLLRATRLTVGRRYDPLRLAESADRVRARLVEAGHRGAWVEPRETAAGGGQDQVDLVLRVEAGPRIDLAWAGDDPGAKVRRLALEAWPLHASMEAAAASIARTVRIELQAAGHYEAKVGHEVRESGAQAEVVLTVARGPRGQGVDVVFEGNSRLSAEELARTLPKAGSREFFETLDRPPQFVARARVAYAGLGHLRARIGPPRARFDEARGRLEVRLPVREGVASRVSALVLPEGIAAPAEGGPELRLREGEPFDVEAYLADRDALAAWYRREGFMETRVRGVLEPQGGDVRVTLIADVGEQARLGEVRIASTGRTREELVRRSVRARPGEVILPRQLAETRARLSDLGTFTSVDVRTVPAPGQEGVRDIELSFVERPDVEFEYGLRYDFSGSSDADSPPEGPTEGRLQAAAALRLANPLGWGWSLGAYTLQTSARHNYRIGIGAPTLAGRRVKTQLLAFDETDDEALIAASFASRVRGFSVQQSHTLRWDTGGRRWHERLRAQWGYTNKDIRYSESVGGEAFLSGNRAFLSIALIGDQRDTLTDPRKGLFWTATAEVSRRFLGSDVDYVRAYGQLFTYVPLPGGIVWAQGYRAGVVPGDDPLFLLENRFQAGGPTTVRGFRQNGLGPQLDEDDGLGGQAVFVFNQELRFPIWKSLKGGAFWDAGNSWLLANEFSLRDIRHTVGAGLRIMLPFGPIRLEYGFILDRREGEPVGRFVFGLGHAF